MLKGKDEEGPCLWTNFAPPPTPPPTPTPPPLPEYILNDSDRRIYFERHMVRNIGKTSD